MFSKFVLLSKAAHLAFVSILLVAFFAVFAGARAGGSDFDRSEAGVGRSSIQPSTAVAGNGREVAVSNTQEPSTPSTQSTAVLLELFTSEGCSTCPPADQLLTKLEQNQPVKNVQVIALSEHVDYWNRLGWTDPFSSADFTVRQREYQFALHLDDVYTPQMIVDGQSSLIGGRINMILEAIAEAANSPKAEVKVTIYTTGPKSVTVASQVENVPDSPHGDKADVMLAITESELQSSVSRGENAGRKLAHSAVTRKLIKLGAIEGGKFNGEKAVDLNSSWKRQNMKAVVFVQEHGSRHVLGAAAIKLPSG